MTDYYMSEGLNSVSFNSASFNSVSFNSMAFNSVAFNRAPFNSATLNSASFGALENFIPSSAPGAPGDWDFVALKTNAANSDSTSLYDDDGTYSAADWTSTDPDPSDDDMLDAPDNCREVDAGVSGRWEQPDVLSVETRTWMHSVEVLIASEPAVTGNMPFKFAQAPRIDTQAPGAGPAAQVPCPRACAWEIKPRLRRRKIGEGSKHSLGGRPVHVLGESQLTPVALTPELLRTCFGLPLHEAARTLGICATAVKKCCRKMGIKQWPYQRLKPIQSRLAKLQSLASTTESAREIKDLEAQRQALLEGHNLECLNGSQ